MARIKREHDEGRLRILRVEAKPAERESVCDFCEASILVGEAIIGSKHAGCAPLKSAPAGTTCGICGGTIFEGEARKAKVGWVHKYCLEKR